MNIKQELFDKALKYILHFEGVYSNDPDDPGGETFLGIARNYHPNADVWKIFDSNKQKYIYADLKEIYADFIFNYVKEFYYNEFFIPLKMDEIPESVIPIYFDTSINTGISRAKKILQNAVGAKPDGIIGPNTIKSINETKCIYEKFKLARIEFYTDLVSKNSKYKKYLLGWINRVLKFEI